MIHDGLVQAGREAVLGKLPMDVLHGGDGRVAAVNEALLADEHAVGLVEPGARSSPESCVVRREGVRGRKAPRRHRAARSGDEFGRDTGAARLLTERQASEVVAMVCAPPPEGRARWTVRLIA